MTLMGWMGRKTSTLSIKQYEEWKSLFQKLRDERLEKFRLTVSLKMSWKHTGQLLKETVTRKGTKRWKYYGRLGVAFKVVYPVGILYDSIAGRYRPVRVADGPITARYRFIKNASWAVVKLLHLLLETVGLTLRKTYMWHCVLCKDVCVLCL